MESASALLKLVHDATSSSYSSNLHECDLLISLESVRKQLQRSASSPEASAIAVCHVTGLVLAFLLQYRPITDQAASSKWHKRVYLLETAATSAFLAFASSVDLKNEARGDLCSMIKCLFQRFWETSRMPQHAVHAVTIMTNLCVLLAICWLSYDRVGNLIKVENLLDFCSNFCSKHESTRQLIKWPLFLLGLSKMTEKQDFTGALECLRSAVETCAGSPEDGVLLYWYAVALLRTGHPDDAITALDKCIRANYEPTACLSLQALVTLQAKDYHAASKQLQRALEINFEDPNAMFNYGLLLERMGNSEAQQQLLEYILEIRGGGSGQTELKRLDLTSKANSTTLFDERDLASLLLSRTASVDVSRVHLRLALAAMDNGSWLESKQHFEHFLCVEDRRGAHSTGLEVARDYVYVLLQCKLPSLALCKCEQYLQNEVTDTVDVVSLHLYKADALLCLERVDECCEYLQQIVQPRVQGIMPRREVAIAVSEELALCHTQLLNNLAVAVACCSGVDAAISILRDGLQQYPTCLAIKFNLVLLLWRKGDKSTACTLWMQARGWNVQGKANDSDATSPLTAYENAAMAASCSQPPPISEHVQGDFDGQDGVSAQQLAYLDALVLSYWRETRNFQLLESSRQHVEYLESLGTTNLPKNN